MHAMPACPAMANKFGGHFATAELRRRLSEERDSIIAVSRQPHFQSSCQSALSYCQGASAPRGGGGGGCSCACTTAVVVIAAARTTRDDGERPARHALPTMSTTTMILVRDVTVVIDAHDDDITTCPITQ